MGNFYGNITVKGPTPEDLRPVLESIDCSALISPMVEAWVVIYEQRSDLGDLAQLDVVAEEVTKKFSCPALGVLNHDDDVLVVCAYDSGNKVYTYDSTPGYFVGNPDAPPQSGDMAVLCELFDRRESLERITDILQGESGLALDRHSELVEELGMPTWAVGFGYRYLNDADDFFSPDEVPDELKSDCLLRVVGDSSDEDTRAADALGVEGDSSDEEERAADDLGGDQRCTLDISFLPPEQGQEDCKVELKLLQTMTVLQRVVTSDSARNYLGQLEETRKRDWPSEITLTVKIGTAPKGFESLAAGIRKRAEELSMTLEEA